MDLIPPQTVDYYLTNPYGCNEDCEVTNWYSFPNTITQLYIETDEQTKCKYAINNPPTSYASMTYLEDNTYSYDHYQNITPSILGGFDGNYTVYFLCEDGAGNTKPITEVKSINFSVLITELYLRQISPAILINTDSGTIIVQATKDLAFCTYDSPQYGSGSFDFISANMAYKDIDNLETISYIFEVTCTSTTAMIGNLTVSFAVDVTPPTYSISYSTNPTKNNLIDVFIDTSEQLGQSPILWFDTSEIVVLPAPDSLQQFSPTRWYGQLNITFENQFDLTDFTAYIEGYDIAGNLGTEITAGNKLTIDTKPPHFTLTNIQPIYAKPGTIVMIEFTSSETLAAAPILYINDNYIGFATEISENNYQIQYTVAPFDLEGYASINISALDTVNNIANIFYYGDFIIDKSPPNVIYSTPANNSVIPGLIGGYVEIELEDNFEVNETATIAATIFEKAGIPEDGTWDIQENLIRFYPDNID
jgi:hypothetical protein